MDFDIYSRFFQFKTAQNTQSAQQTLKEISNAQKNELIYKKNEDNLYDWKTIAEKVSKGLTEKNHHVVTDIIRANIWFSSTAHNCFRSLEYKELFEELKKFYKESATCAKSCFGITLYNEIYGRVTAPPTQHVRKPTLVGLLWLAIKTLLFVLGFIFLLLLIMRLIQ